MKITFCGAARMVTGSCYYVECGNARLLVDCGMLQGQDEDKSIPFPVAPNKLDFVLLTHAHIDHSGRLPLLYKMGFRGKIICTKATEDLCSIMLADSAHIQEMEVVWQNRKRERAGKPPIEPLYTVADAQGAMTLFRSYLYDEEIILSDALKLRFKDAGHLLGSASIEVWLTEGGQTRKVAFSGDIGNTDQPIIKDPTYITDADFILVESTYGDRLHEKEGTHTQELADIINETFKKGGNVIIPSFAVGRTQELLYLLREILQQHLVPNFPNFPVFVDSPLAVEATEIFMRNNNGYYDEEAMRLMNNHINPISFPSLHTVVYAEQSKELNTNPQSCVIISSSGMCEAGRIKHHLKHNLWRKECSIVFAGFQAVGTLGRSILDGAKKVTIFGEEIEVNANIYKLGNISGHADKAGLLRWLGAFRSPIQKIFVVHGEEPVALGFCQYLVKELNDPAIVPKLGETFDLLANELRMPARVVPKQDMRPAMDITESLQRLSGSLSSDEAIRLQQELQALYEKWEDAAAQKR